MNIFTIQKVTQVDDGIGGLIDGWDTFKEVEGYIDLLTGTDSNSTIQNAFTEESTHILIIPKFTTGITDKMRILEPNGRFYSITYSDNPMGINHHNEVYCKFSGVVANG